MCLNEHCRLYFLEDSDLRKTKSAKHSRKTLSREKSESIQKKKSPSVEKTKSRQTGDLSDCKVIENFKGKVKTILNENFGLIEFCLDLKYPSFCLFDTFDLFVETGLTAAQSKLTVGNVLSLEMEVFLMSVLCRSRAIIKSQFAIQMQLSVNHFVFSSFHRMSVPRSRVRAALRVSRAAAAAAAAA